MKMFRKITLVILLAGLLSIFTQPFFDPNVANAWRRHGGGGGSSSTVQPAGNEDNDDY
jgi:hypothetical protein